MGMLSEHFVPTVTRADEEHVLFCLKEQQPDQILKLTAAFCLIITDLKEKPKPKRGIESKLKCEFFNLFFKQR